MCACLGLLSQGQADRLRSAGADAYNHNLNTSEGTYGEITTTHTYADRVDTVQQAQAAGLSACSGLIAGMGETDADLVDVVFSLRALDPDSVPVNFLIPIEGTPLAKEWHLTPSGACASWRWSGSSARTSRCGSRAGARSICARCSRSP